MRIIELCLAKSLGGLELYFEKCCRWFHKSPHYMLPIVLKGSRLEKRLNDSRIPFAALNSSSKSLFLFNAYKIAILIENHNIEIVHIHDKKELLIMAFAKLLSRKKFKLVHSRQMQLPHSKKDLWHRFLYKKISLYITITERLQKDAIKRLPLEEDKIQMLYYGVNASVPYNAKTCNTFLGNGKPGRFKIGIFSRIEHLKGQHLVIEAAHLLQKHFPHLEYFFIGDVMFQDYFENLKKTTAQYNLEKIIYFKGFHPAPMEIMPCFDLILLPSYNETFGLVLAEAMRSGVAVIGTDYGGVPEIIDDLETGLLFERGNPKSLYEKIKLLIENEALRISIAKKGKEKADSLFNEEGHFIKLERLLQGVINC